jgi:hypothetical protein
MVGKFSGEGHSTYSSGGEFELVHQADLGTKAATLVDPAITARIIAELTPTCPILAQKNVCSVQRGVQMCSNANCLPTPGFVPLAMH